MTENVPSVMGYPPSYIPTTDNSIDQQPWIYFFGNILPSLSQRLKIIGIINLVIGIISIGFEGGIMSKGIREDSISILIYDLNPFGIYLFLFGLLLLLLFEEQLYVLFPLFLYLAFQLIHLIKRLFSFSFIIRSWTYSCSETHSTDCGVTTQKALVVLSYLFILIGTLLTIYTMFIIKQAFNPRSRTRQQQQYLMPLAYVNSPTTSNNA